jgi:hypothetical protein
MSELGSAQADFNLDVAASIPPDNSANVLSGHVPLPCVDYLAGIPAGQTILDGALNLSGKMDCKQNCAASLELRQRWSTFGTSTMKLRRV